MKKNNRFRNNGNGCSNAYSLNYRFDSVSPAGKCSGTALDLIKRYNELAKEAHGSGDYVAMEVYRQYAEHYRKIVTEINERKGVRSEMTADTSKHDDQAVADGVADNAGTEAPQEALAEVPAERPVVTKSFHVVEIHPDDAGTLKAEKIQEVAPEKPKRIVRRRKSVATESTEARAEVI